jgi:hypothetical protein
MSSGRQIVGVRPPGGAQGVRPFEETLLGLVLLWGMQHSILQQFVLQHPIHYLLNVFFRKDHALNLVAYPSPALYREEGERLPQVVIPANVKEFLERPHDALKAVFFLGNSDPSGTFSAFPGAHARSKQ